jgi:hypothetical protein
MPKKVKFTDLVIGTGLKAESHSQVTVHVRGTLNKGEAFMDTKQELKPLGIELQKRDCIDGLRYGIIGMREGGRRELIVGPHLGYGAKGIPGKIPPDAVLKFEVELLEVNHAGTSNPADYPPGKHLYAFWPGEASCNRPRVQFGLEESGRCGVSLAVPQPGQTWRYAKNRAAEEQLDEGDRSALFEEVASIFKNHPQACLHNDMLWADASEKANSVTRDTLTNTPCVSIGIQDRGKWLCYYSLRQNEPLLLQSKLFAVMKRLTDMALSKE